MRRRDSIDEPVGLRVEHAPALSRSVREDPEPSLVVPLERSVVVLEPRGGGSERLDRASFALVPARTPYRLTARSTVTTLVTLVVGPAARDAVCHEYAPYVEASRFAALLATFRVLPRTRWVDELVARYVFERKTCEKHGTAAAVFLETELTKELFFLCAERAKDQTRASVVHEEAELVQRARAVIDESPFASPRVGELARRCGTSESTLLRAFQRELATTPAAYAREARLDAALLMLQDGRHTVGEVATRVGYTTLSAFTAAFRRRHGRAPSSVRRPERALEPLRPDGAPMRRKRASH